MVRFRGRHVQLLDRPDPPEIDLILHEAALRMEFGGPTEAGAMAGWGLRPGVQ